MVAIGDVRHGSGKLVAPAVGEGVMAIDMVHDQLAKLGGPRNNYRTTTRSRDVGTAG